MSFGAEHGHVPCWGYITDQVGDMEDSGLWMQLSTV